MDEPHDKRAWAARDSHTSVIDAAGAIYVIGGEGYSNGYHLYRDLWVSTDGGARPASRGARGVLKRTHGVPRGYSMGYSAVLCGTLL